jgi:hypothetical protein
MIGSSKIIKGDDLITFDRGEMEMQNLCAFVENFHRGSKTFALFIQDIMQGLA